VLLVDVHLDVAAGESGHLVHVIFDDEAMSRRRESTCSITVVVVISHSVLSAGASVGPGNPSYLKYKPSLITTVTCTCWMSLRAHILPVCANTVARVAFQAEQELVENHMAYLSQSRVGL
jgi:hypothetical protein